MYWRRFDFSGNLDILYSNCLRGIKVFLATNCNPNFMVTIHSFLYYRKVL